ncbi:fatty acid desaturase family protein [Dactylosporangium siamense]|uniref:Delta fatty acid desaturase n=1 Tax=Dactylosporangium siamense TaxID=685454 RepID=A0A919U9G3_9ACTN|nr:acyl-CoA desaturase [Dactylosporangium siamense]GIG47529.1 delta fatty acid desaturase [Dactylosporangium siamense]
MSAFVQPSQYAQLSRHVKQAGLLERRGGYYATRIAAVGGLLVATWTAFVLIGQSWWQLLTAVLLAALFTQVGFIGHDAGHRQIFRSRRANDLLGILHANLAIGLSYGWWVDKHSRHHANPNTEGADPDIVVVPLAFSARQAAGLRGLRAAFIRVQGYLFLPLLTLEAMSLHLSSVQAVFRAKLRRRPTEITLLAAHAVLYLTAVFVVLNPLQGLVFIAVHQGLFGIYLGSAFAPNHKGMPILSADNNLDYLRRQVLTSRNVRGGWLVDTALGGLNYQIEHHLFPSMPRPNLRRAQVLVRRFCAENGVDYCETSLWRSWREVLRHLDGVGAALTPSRR